MIIRAGVNVGVALSIAGMVSVFSAPSVAVAGDPTECSEYADHVCSVDFGYVNPSPEYHKCYLQYYYGCTNSGLAMVTPGAALLVSDRLSLSREYIRPIAQILHAKAK